MTNGTHKEGSDRAGRRGACSTRSFVGHQFYPSCVLMTQILCSLIYIYIYIYIYACMYVYIYIEAYLSIMGYSVPMYLPVLSLSLFFFIFLFLCLSLSPSLSLSFSFFEISLPRRPRPLCGSRARGLHGRAETSFTLPWRLDFRVFRVFRV